MNNQVCGLLLASQFVLISVSTAQTNSVHAMPNQVVAVGAVRARPVIAVSPRALDFMPLEVGKRKTLTFSVQNCGMDTVSGAAKVSAPFSIIGGSPYVLRSSQRQVITVQYSPTAVGINATVVLLTGGSSGRLTVSGSAIPASRTGPAAPPAPTNIRILARR